MKLADFARSAWNCLLDDSIKFLTLEYFTVSPQWRWNNTVWSDPLLSLWSLNNTKWTKIYVISNTDDLCFLRKADGFWAIGTFHACVCVHPHAGGCRNYSNVIILHWPRLQILYPLLSSNTWNNKIKQDSITLYTCCCFFRLGFELSIIDLWSWSV